jgi:Mn-dependent DtxR family transcriptional regulator
MQGYFRVSAPSVHQMVLSLEKLGFIERTPSQGRSLKLLLPREQLPDLV